ncbi:MAG: hypothetical protein AAF449_14510, partial [Myxococcota bacterium]
PQRVGVGSEAPNLSTNQITVGRVVPLGVPVPKNPQGEAEPASVEAVASADSVHRAEAKASADSASQAKAPAARAKAKASADSVDRAKAKASADSVDRAEAESPIDVVSIAPLRKEAARPSKRHRRGSTSDAEPSPKPSGPSKDAVRATRQINGFLTVDTIPWTNIWVDGRPYGSTPRARISVPTGRRQLRLVNDAESIDHTAMIEIRADKTIRIRRVFGEQRP